MPNALQLSISDEAKRRITLMLHEFRAHFNKDAIPAIMWIDSPLNNGAIESQPAIGLYDNKDDIAAGDLLFVDEMEIAIAFSEHDIIHFQEKTLDYERGRFFLR